MFINVDPLVVMDEHFKAHFTKKQLEKRGIDPDKIVIEITERNTVNNIGEFIETIKHYKNEGYKIAIDDVGSCYSGLNIICKTHPDYLKIDMELVRDIDKDYMKYALVKGLVEIAKNTSMKVLAEGIETEAELKALINLNVDYGQGYLIGRPEKKIRQINDDVLYMISNYAINESVHNANNNVS